MTTPYCQQSVVGTTAQQPSFENTRRSEIPTAELRNCVRKSSRLRAERRNGRDSSSSSTSSSAGSGRRRGVTGNAFSNRKYATLHHHYRKGGKGGGHRSAMQRPLVVNAPKSLEDDSSDSCGIGPPLPIKPRHHKSSDNVLQLMDNPQQGQDISKQARKSGNEHQKAVDKQQQQPVTVGHFSEGETLSLKTGSSCSQSPRRSGTTAGTTTAGGGDTHSTSDSCSKKAANRRKKHLEEVFASLEDSQNQASKNAKSNPDSKMSQSKAEVASVVGGATKVYHQAGFHGGKPSGQCREASAVDYTVGSLTPSYAIAFTQILIQ